MSSKIKNCNVFLSSDTEGVWKERLRSQKQNAPQVQQHPEGPQVVQQRPAGPYVLQQRPAAPQAMQQPRPAGPQAMQ